MILEENNLIIENKELKANTQNKRFIYVNNTSESSFPNGLVTLINQEQFNQFKKEFNELKELHQNPITKEDLQLLEDKVQQLQEEKNQLEKDNEELTESLEEASFKLELALNNKQFEETTSSKDKTISILEEDKTKLEEKISFYESKVNDLEEENKKLVEKNQSTKDSLKEENHDLRLALGIVLSKYDILKNRSFIGRILNNDTEKLDEYRKLTKNIETYEGNPEIIEAIKKE